MNGTVRQTRNAATRNTATGPLRANVRASPRFSPRRPAPETASGGVWGNVRQYTREEHRQRGGHPERLGNAPARGPNVPPQGQHTRHDPTDDHPADGPPEPHPAELLPRPLQVPERQRVGQPIAGRGDQPVNQKQPEQDLGPARQSGTQEDQQHGPENVDHRQQPLRWQPAVRESARRPGGSPPPPARTWRRSSPAPVPRAPGLPGGPPATATTIPAPCRSGPSSRPAVAGRATDAPPAQRCHRPCVPRSVPFVSVPTVVPCDRSRTLVVRSFYGMPPGKWQGSRSRRGTRGRTFPCASRSGNLTCRVR